MPSGKVPDDVGTIICGPPTLHKAVDDDNAFKALPPKAAKFAQSGRGMARNDRSSTAANNSDLGATLNEQCRPVVKAPTTCKTCLFCSTRASPMDRPQRTSEKDEDVGFGRMQGLQVCPHRADTGRLAPLHVKLYAFREGDRNEGFARGDIRRRILKVKRNFIPAVVFDDFCQGVGAESRPSKHREEPRNARLPHDSIEIDIKANHSVINCDSRVAFWVRA